MQTMPSINWGKETTPRLCIPRNERNPPRIRSLLHMAPIGRNDQPQRIGRKLLAQTAQTDGQSPSHSRRVATFFHTCLHVRNIALGTMVSSEKYHARVQS